MMKSLLTKKTYKNTTTMTESDPAANEEAVPTAAVVAVVVSPVTPGGELAYDWPTNVPPPAAEVLHLWTEVGNGLEKSQTVVWKSAVESLDHANKTLATSQDARLFLEKYMAQIIGILVEQQPNKIGPYERDCVHDSLSKAIDIVVQDLEIQIRRNGECLLLPALSHVFNKKRPYYKGGKQAWNNHIQAGLPETRMRMIQRFRQCNGFRLLHTYMVERIGTPAFPNADHIHQILTASADAIARTRSINNNNNNAVVANNASGGGGGPANNDKKQDPSALITEVEDDAITVANAVMQSINNLSDDDLKKMPVDNLQQMQGDLKCIFDKLVATRRGSTRDFYAFWRGLALRLITNPSLPLKLFGWDLVNELILACAEHRPPPRFFIVTNAGCSFVNGRFDYGGPVTPDGYFKPGADICYVRKIPEGEEQGGHKLTLFRCTMRSHQKWWFLSEADEEQPGTDRDIDYYQHKSKEHEEGVPPPRGWTTCRSAGMDPPPHLKQHGSMVPPGEEHSTLEHQLAKWAIDNNIVEQVLGDTTIHREVVSRSTQLIKFLAQMCSRDDLPPAADDDDTAGVAVAGTGADSAMLTEPNKYCLQASHLLYAWKTCTRKADAAVATQVYQLLVSILPLCPSDLGVPLLKAVQESLTEPNKDNHDYLFEVGEFCGALATGTLMEVKNGNGCVLPDEVREEALNLLWSVLTHPDATALKSYDDLKRYVTHELRVEPKGSELRERFLQSCITTLAATAQLRGETPVEEDQALLMVKLTHFVLEACPRQQSEECVTRDSGALAMLLFDELTAHLERKKKGAKTSYFRKSTSSSKSKKPAESTAVQQGLALHERLRFLRHVFGLSGVRAGPTDPIVMSLEMVGTLWQLCEHPDDRESLMLFIASAAFNGKMNADVTNHMPVVQPGTAQAPDPNALFPAFTEDVCRAVFLSLYCSPDFNYSHLGEQGYRSFNSLFLHVRGSPVATAEDKKIALDAQWRVCLTVGNHAIATHAMRDLLSVYISASLNSVNPRPQPMVTDDIHESFGERISQCLATVKAELDEKAPFAEQSTERCLRILNAAIGQQIDSGGYSMTPSTLTRLSQLPSTASLEDALRCLPHGMRGRASYIRIGVMAKCPQQNQHPGQSPRHAVRDNGNISNKQPSIFKFTLDIHPLETIHSVKYKVALHCQCPLTSVRPVQISGRSYGTRSGAPEQQLNFSSVPEDTVVDELGIVQGCEIVFVLAERQTNTVVPLQSARGIFNNDLSSVFFNDDSKFADQLFYMLLGILESLPRRDPEQMSESKSPPPTSVYQLVWDLIVSMPTNLSVASRVKAACGLAGDSPSVTSADDAMEVDSTAGDNWSQLLDTRNFNRSVYVLLMVDALLQPAPETLTILPQELQVALEKRLGEDANAFRRVFIDSGGFAAVVRFFSRPEGDVKAHTGEARRGNAVALRILKACLFGDGSDTPTAHDENVVPPDEAGSKLLRSLSDTDGLLKTLTSMVVDDSGISSSTIMDVLRFLRLLFRSKRAADSFTKLPGNLAKRLLVTLLTRDEDSDTRTSSSISAALNVRNSVHDLILQTSHLADEALPWLVDAVGNINFQSENASELFDTLERLVSGSDGTARSRAASPKELRHLGTVVCQKLVSCPRPTSESEASDLSTAVLCGCLKLLRALINSSGGPVLREGADLLVKAIGVGRWSEANGASNRGVLAMVASPFSSKTNSDDATLVDLMGVVFDGFLTPLESASVSICCDKDSRCLGFEVVDAAARACRGGDGYMALVSRVDGLVSSCSPSLRHRWGQFGGGGDSHSRVSRATSKYSGLRNQGCTCYMNSALQQLFMMPELRDSMCNAPIPSNFRVSGGVMSSKGAELVGKKISLQWENANSHEAIVEGFDEHTGMHTIRYCPVQVATVGSGHHQQVRPEEVDRLPIALADEFVLSDGRPGKETGVFEVVPDPLSDANIGPAEREESDAMQDDEVKETEDESSSRHLLEEVQRTFIHLDEGSKGRCFDPRALVEACACLKLEFDVWQQNDASEFVTKLLDRLEISLKRWAPKHFEYMDHTFGLKQTQQKICKECGLKTNREEKLLSIDCQIRGKSDIHEALAAMTEADVMEGSNKVLCDRCKKKTDTILRTAISTLPNMLILSLKRFDLDFNTFETVKLNSRCAFGHTLNMKHYTIEALEALEKSEGTVDPAPMDIGEGGHTEPSHDPLSTLPDEDYEYRLAGVLVHAGVAQGGHYYSFIRDRYRGGEEKWYRFDDEDVTPFNPSLIENECFGGKVKKETKWPNGQVHTVEQEQFANALMLFYEKVKPTDCPGDSERKDNPAPPKTLQTSTGYDVFKPDVRRSNATHRWQSFLFDAEFQNFLKGMLQICETSVVEQSPDTWCAPLVQTLLNFVFDVMMYSSDRSSLNDWTQKLECILYRDVKIARALAHKLAKKTEMVSGNWLRTYLLDCPDRASRACSVKIFVAAMGSCASINTEQRALDLWTQAWREMGERLSHDRRESKQDIVHSYPSSLIGQWKSLENPDTMDGVESSCLGIILSFTNMLLDYMPRCWRFSGELCMFLRCLAVLKTTNDQRHIFRWAMVEAMMPARIICIVARERSSRFLQLAFPGASISNDVANTQVRVESNTSSVMTMGGNQVMGSSDMNNGRQSSFDYQILLEALACLAGLPGVVTRAVTRDIEETGRGRNRTVLTDAATDALKDIFFDHCAPGAPGMMQREVEYYLRSSGVDSNAASSQKIADMMAKYPITSDGEQGIAYLSVEGFLAYYRDMAQTNELKVQLDLHKFGFRPDLTRRSRDARIQVINGREAECRAPESVALDVAENLEQQVNFGLLTDECFNSFASGIFPVAFDVSEPLALYLVAAAVFRRADPERIINHFLKVIHQTPNDWNANATVSNTVHALTVIACIPDGDQMSRIGIIMQSSAQSRNCEYGVGLLNVIRFFHRSRQAQHYSNELQWGLERYMNILKSLQRVYPIHMWMSENRDKWTFIERDVLDERSAGMHRHHAQPRGDYGTRDVENNHMPLDHHSHTDSDMADMNDSDDDDEITTDAFGHETNDGPYQIIIESAGTPEVNGIYSQDGYFENACKYSREGKWKNMDYRFLIFQCNVSNNTKHWYISIVPYAGNPGTSSDIDFYSAPATPECMRIPPAKGWVKAPEGQEPSPELSFRTKEDVIGVVVVGNDEEEDQQDEENEENQSWPMDGPGDEPDENITGISGTSTSSSGGPGNTGVQDLRSRYI